MQEGHLLEDALLDAAELTLDSGPVVGLLVALGEEGAVAKDLRGVRSKHGQREAVVGFKDRARVADDAEAV